MPITLGNNASAGNGYGNTVSTSGVSITNDGNSALIAVAVVSYGSAPSSAPTDTYANNYQLAQSIQYAYSNDTLYLWYAIGAKGGSSNALQLNLTGYTSIALGLQEFKGVGPGTFDLAPTGTVVNGGSSLTSPAVLTSVPLELVIAAIGDYSGGTTFTDSGVGFSTALSYSGTGRAFALSWALPASAGTSASDTFTASASSYYGALTLSIIPGSTGFALEDEGEWFQYIQVAA